MPAPVNRAAPAPFPTSRVPAKPIIPLPDAPIEYPPAEEPSESTPEEEQMPGAPPSPEPVPAPAEPEPALPAGTP